MNYIFGPLQILKALKSKLERKKIGYAQRTPPMECGLLKTMWQDHLARKGWERQLTHERERDNKPQVETLGRATQSLRQETWQGDKHDTKLQNKTGSDEKKGKALTLTGPDSGITWGMWTTSFYFTFLMCLVSWVSQAN